VLIWSFTPRLLTEPYVTVSRHTALDHTFDARSKYQCEQLRILSPNKTQPVLRLTYRDSVLALYPFEQARWQRAPQSIAETSVPEFPVVFDPSSNHSIVPARKIPQVIRRGSMNAPVFDRVVIQLMSAVASG